MHNILALTHAGRWRITRRASTLRPFMTLASWAILGGVWGCSDQPTAANSYPSNDRVLYAVEVSPRAVMMTPLESQPLAVTIRNILGNVMTRESSDSLAFTTNDPAHVTVDADGVLHAVAATPFDPFSGHSPARIIVTFRSGTITKSDTIFVAVTDTAPTTPITSMSIAPASYPADSTWRSRLGFMTIPVTGRTAAGDSVGNLFAYLFTEARRRGVQDIVDIPSASVTFYNAPGKFWIYATARLYGQDVVDSVQYLTMDQLFASTALQPSITGGVITSDVVVRVAACGFFQVTNSLPDSVRVTLAGPPDTTGCMAGNPPEGTVLAATEAAFFRVGVSGLYTWTAVHANGTPFTPEATGKVRVRDRTEF